MRTTFHSCYTLEAAHEFLDPDRHRDRDGDRIIGVTEVTITVSSVAPSNPERSVEVVGRAKFIYPDGRIGSGTFTYVPNVPRPAWLQDLVDAAIAEHQRRFAGVKSKRTSS